MEKYIFRFLTALLLSSSVFMSCQKENVPGPGPQEGETAVNLSFCVLPNCNEPLTRSSIMDTTSEGTVKDMNIWIYRDNVLYRQYYRKTLSDTTIKIDTTAGHTFKLLALANVGKITPKLTLDSLKNANYFRLDGITPAYMSAHGLPMADTCTSFNPASGNHTIHLERYVARYDFKIDKSKLRGTFTVDSVKLCQSRKCLNPFDYEYRMAASGEVTGGDSSSVNDIQTLNANKSAVFYAVQNEQGEVSGITSPWDKTPEKIGAKADVATYIYLRGTYKDSTLLERKMTYRFYLGKNATTNFDVIKNYHYVITFFPSDSSTSKMVWKVEGVNVGEDKREFKIGDKPIPDTLQLPLNSDTSLLFSSNCGFDTLCRPAASTGLRFEFRKASSSNATVDTLKVFASDKAVYGAVDSIKFATYDRAKSITLRISVAPPTYPEAPDSVCKKVGGVWWAPVNCGFDAAKFKWGKLYQFGRMAGCGYVDTLSGAFNDAGGRLQTTVIATFPDDGCTKYPDDTVFYIFTVQHWNTFDWYTNFSGSQMVEWPMSESKAPSGSENIGNPCPDGWRVPTKSEMDALWNGATPPKPLIKREGISGAEFSGVFLPAAGYRWSWDGYVYKRDSLGSYWTSNAIYKTDGNYFVGQAIGFYEGAAAIGAALNGSASALSVRCVMKQE